MTYPLQYFRLALFDTDQNVILSGTSISVHTVTGQPKEKWYLNYIKKDTFQILNASNSKALAASGTSLTLSNPSNTSSQYWKISVHKKDYEGYGYYYKVLNNGDTSKALTYTSSGFTLTTYSGASYQKYKLNLDGLEGFAGNCITSLGEKAGTIGGLLGPVVTVTTADELEAQLKTTEAKTIVVNANISMKNKMHTRIRDNKTLVGSFKYHTIYDSYFRTNNEYGTEGDEPSDNIVIRNLDFQAKDVSNRILINIWSSRQIWIDHCNFKSNLPYNRKGDGQDEVGKFIWVNTPYESYMDKKDRNRSPDYVTISYCKFAGRYWTVAYGTQNDETTRDRTTLLFNYWYQNVRRCPQLGNGIMHVYNNYYEAFGEKNNGSATTGIIGGDGSNVVSQCNMFNGYTVLQALNMGFDTNKNPARDDNSYISTELNTTPGKISYTPKNKSTWYPKTNYGYKMLDGYNTKGTDTKTFVTKYAGCFNSQSGIKYIGDSDFAGWASAKYIASFLKSLDTTKLRAKNPKKEESEKEVVKTEVYKTDDLVHTVVFIK